MKKRNFSGRIYIATVLLCLFTMAAQGAMGQIITTISAGTKVHNGGQMVTLQPGSFINNGSYTDTTASGALVASGGAVFGGSGTTSLYRLDMINAGTSVVNTLMSVYNTATIGTGATVSANNNIFIRSDLKPGANSVVSGIVTGDIQGIVVRSAIVSLSCFSHATNLSVNISGPVVQYQWQSSPDSTIWADITGATSAVYTASGVGINYYRCNLSTSNSSFTKSTPGLKLMPAFSSSTGVSSSVIICNGSSATLTATGGGVYSWVPSAGLSATTGAVVVANPTVTTTYTVTNCIGSATVTVSVNQLIPPYNITGGGAYCTGGSGTLIGLDGSQPGISYQLKRGTTSVGSPVTGTGSALSFGLQTTAGIYTSVATDPGSGCTAAMAGSSGVTIYGGWTNVGTAGFSAGVGNYCNMTMDGAGVPYVAFRDEANGGKATVMRYNGSSWVTVGTAGFSSGAAGYMSIAISGSGVPFLAYGDGSFGHATVKKFNGSNWETVGVERFTGASADWISLAIDAGGMPIVAYTGGGGSKATAMKFDGSSWVAVGTLGFSAGAAYYTSLALDGAGTPYVSYMDWTLGQRATVMKFNGSSWVTVGSPGFSVGPSWFTSIAVTGSGVPYVAYGDGGLGSRASVKKFDGSNWVAVGIAGFSTAQAGNTSLVMDGAGTPYLGYVDWGNGQKATAMKFDGSNWAPVWAVGLSAGTVDYTEMAISGGIPYLVYKDNGNSGKTTVMKANSIVSPIGGATAICVGAAATLSHSVSGGTWSSSATAIAVVGGISGVVSGLAPGTAVITYSASCFTVTTVVTISALPVVSAGDDIAVCRGSSTTLTAKGGATYSWMPGTGLSATTGSSVAATPTLTTTYTVTGTNPAGCSNIATVTVTVNPLPDAGTITGIATVCAGAATSLSNASSGGAWNSSNTSVATVGSTGVVSGVSAGNALISYSVTNICGTATTSIVFTVNPMPDAGTITGTSNVCEGSSATLGNTVLGGSWSSSNTSVATIGSGGALSGVAGGTATISYSISNSCGSATTQSVITVNALPITMPGIADIAYNYSGTIETFVVPVGVESITIEARGAQGGSGNINGGTGGSGAIMRGSFAVTPGHLLRILVGQRSEDAGSSAGGGGGTFVWDATASNTLLIAAGGGGGCAIFGTNGLDASTGNSGVNGGGPGAGNGGTSGLGATSGAFISTNAFAGGGAGWVSNGANGGHTGGSCGIVSAGGYTPLSGGGGGIWGGAADVWLGPGGFGGGGGAQGSCVSFGGGGGGGGGYSGGGAGGADGAGCAGGGGGSYNVGTSQDNSVGNTGNGLVTISIATEMSIVGGGSYCSGGDGLAIGLNSSQAGVNYQLYNGSSPVGSPVAGTGGALSFGIQEDAGAYSVTAINDVTGCSAVLHDTTAIVVNPLPYAGEISGADTVAIGDTILFDVSSAGGTWFSSNTSIATVGSTGALVAWAMGVVTISYVVTNGCGVAIATKTVSVYANIADVTGGASVCVGVTTLLSNATTGGTWSSSSTSIATVGTSGIVEGVAAGTATISYGVPAGAGTAYATVIVTVNPVPYAGTISGTTTICAGTGTVLTSSVTGGTWSSSDVVFATVDSTTGIVAGITPGTSTISYAVTNGCGTDVVTANVTVDLLTPGISGITSVCIGSATTLSHPVSGGTWASSSTAIATVGTAGIVTGISNGTTNITYTTGSGCYGIAQVTVGIASITGTTNVCLGTSSTLSHPVSGGAWSSSAPFFATVDAATGTVTGVHTGTATISYTIGSGCYRTATVYVSNISMIVSGNLAPCAGSASALTCGSTGGIWTSGSTSVAAINASTGVMAAFTVGTVDITYSLAACRTVRTATVNALPDSTAGLSAVCTGSTINLANATGGGTWSSSNTTKAVVGSSTGIVTGVGAGTVSISYTAAGCSRVKVITVGAMPAVITGALAMCEGNSTTLTTTTTGGTWSSGTTGTASVISSSGTTAVISGTSAGMADISYNHSGGCIRTATVTVNAAAEATTGSAVVCTGGTTVLSNALFGGTWSSSATVKATVGSLTGIVTGIAAGTANITYRTSITCFTTTLVTVSTIPAISGGASVCIGYTTPLSHTVSGTWSSSNTARATVDITTGVVTGISAGAVSITCHVSPGCYTVKAINIYNLPSAISGTPTVCEGSVRTLTSSGGNTWSSSDTSIATVLVTPGQVTGVSEGTATITYRATATGCFVMREVTVHALPSVISGSTPVCAGSATTYTNTLSGGVWSRTSATVMSIDSVAGNAMALAGGGTTIRYTMPTGCMVSKAVTVNPLPAAITGVLAVCVGNTAVLSSATSGSIWSSSDSSTAMITVTTTSACIVSGISAGMANIVYTNTHGCSRTAIVTVNAALPASSGSSIICVGNTMTVFNTATGGTWASSTPAKATVVSGTGLVSGLATGTTNITYSIGSGCLSIMQVTVNPAVATISGTLSVCVGQTTRFTSTDAGGTWSSSNESIATVDPSGIITGVAPGTTVITYMLGGGCYKTKSITVKALPVISGPSMLGVGATTLFSGSPTGGAWASSASGIATIGFLTGSVTGIAMGVATITYTAVGCYATMDISVSVASSRPGIAATETSTMFSVYPNPTSGSLTINASVGGIFTVYTLEGKQAQQYAVSAGVTNIRLPYSLAAGVYMCRFNGEDGSIETVRLYVQ